MFLACTGDVPRTSPEPAATTPAAETRTPESPSAPEPRADRITAAGWGPLRIGMTLAEVTAAAGQDANPDAAGGPEPERCDEFRPSEAPAGILVMVENGVLTRISVSRNRDIRTPEGLGIGDPESRVLDAYGSRAEVGPHKYVGPPAKTITVWTEPRSSANPRAIRYEIDAEGKVAHIRAGGPSIEYVEGCL